MRVLPLVAVLAWSAPLAAQEAPRLQLSIGFGAGGLTGAGSGKAAEPFSQGASYTISCGVRTSEQIHLLFNGEYTAFARYRFDPRLSQQQAAVTIAALWHPNASGRRLAVERLDPGNVSLKLGLGVAHLIQVPYADPFVVPEQGPWAPALTAGAGWFPLRTPGWELGFEATDSVGFYETGPRHNFGVNVVARLLLL